MTLEEAHTWAKVRYGVMSYLMVHDLDDFLDAIKEQDEKKLFKAFNSIRAREISAGKQAIKDRDREWAKHLSPNLDHWDGLTPEDFMSFPDKVQEIREADDQPK